MRIGLIADIHGNLLALERVLAELRHERVDEIVCLGDLAALGPQPSECIARVRELCCPTVLGNTDEWLLHGVPPDTSLPVAELTRWAAGRLSAADRAYLASLPLSLERPLPLGSDERLWCFHGSPRSHEDIIAATTPTNELAKMFGGHARMLMAGGHTHVPLLRAYVGGRLLNPGSVGLPGVGPGGPALDTNQDVGWAEYALVSVAKQGISIDLRRTQLDVAKMLRAAQASEMPRLEWWTGRWQDV
jgi:predicted phosphodiesterase